MDEFFPEIMVTAEQAEAMARGLYAVAAADGEMHDREKALLMSFYGGLDETAQSFSALENRERVDTEAIASALPTRGHALLFLKTCILMAYADNNFGSGERELINSFAEALAVSPEELESLEAGVKSYLLGHIVTLANSEAVLEVSKELNAV